MKTESPHNSSFTIQTFFEKFDQFVDAPNAIPAMRELILQLAVRGNLTERVAGESSKAQLALADAFRIRRAKRDEPDAEDIPFQTPENWGWVAVGDSMEMINGRAFKPEEWSTEGTPIIRIQNLNNVHAAFNYCNADLDPKIHVHDGEFLISWSGTPGTSFGAFIWNRGFAYLNQHIFRCELVKGIFVKEFLRLAINARLDEMISHAQGAVGLRHITKGKLESIRLPLPPLAEQERIVAKVDELMALCDQLETLQQERETQQAALARASLARFANEPTPANLNFIFRPTYTITPADLRKSILTLAVQGKLVPQDPADEPLHTTFADLKPSDVHDHEAVESLPPNWQKFAYRTLTSLVTSGSRGWKEFYAPTGSIFIRTQNIKTDRLLLDDVAYVQVPEANDGKRAQVRQDDIMITITGANVTKAARVETAIPEAYVSQHIALTRPKWPSISPWLHLCFVSPGAARGVLESLAYGDKPGLNLENIRGLILPVPPLAEQRRIVAKVGELMTLVDELELQMTTSRDTAAKLLSALVAELTAVSTPSSDAE